MSIEAVDSELQIAMPKELHDFLCAIRAAICLVHCKRSLKEIDSSLRSTVLAFDSEALWSVENFQCFISSDRAGMITYTKGPCNAAPANSGGTTDVFKYLKPTSPWALDRVGVGLEDGGIGKDIVVDTAASAEEVVAAAVESWRFRSWSFCRTSKSALLPPKSIVMERKTSFQGM